MPNDIVLLIWTAVTIGFVHTLLGPDHYVPFIVLSKSRQWSSIKTLIITLLCGVGHVLSSIILGFVGIGLGIAVFRLESIEAFRGDIAAWLLIAFGFTYLIWGVHRALRGKMHTHAHVHEGGIAHSHVHGHFDEHTHVHASKTANVTPWIPSRPVLPPT